MRDPKRIKRICRLLEKNWSKCPDQRLGQFLTNFIYGHYRDIFYTEDTIVEDKLTAIQKAIKKNTQ